VFIHGSCCCHTSRSTSSHLHTPSVSYSTASASVNRNAVMQVLKGLVCLHQHADLHQFLSYVLLGKLDSVNIELCCPGCAPACRDLFGSATEPYVAIHLRLGGEKSYTLHCLLPQLTAGCFCLVSWDVVAVSDAQVSWHVVSIQQTINTA
jgi:hypothetical protein